MKSQITRTTTLTACTIVAALALQACASSDHGSNGLEWETSDDSGDGTNVEDTTNSTDSTSNGGTPASRTLCTVSGRVTAPTTIAPDAKCPDGYRVTDGISVSGADGILTIAPGTKLKFDAGTELSVGNSGTLKAIGTAEQPILFTGWQPAPGSWNGIYVASEAVGNEISNAIVEYAGASSSDQWGAVSLGDGEHGSVLSLSFVQLRKSGKFGLSLAPNVTLSKFENNLISENAAGAMRARTGSVQQFKGLGNQLVNNGANNSVRITPGTVYGNVTWPNLAPSPYRALDETGYGGQLTINGHLTIEPGTQIDFAPGMGIAVQDGNAGLSAVGTESQPIVLRGIDGAAWLGIGFAQTSWTGNALENVRFENAHGAPDNSHGCTISGGRPGLTSVIVGQLTGPGSYLRVKNVSFQGPNAAENDIWVVSPATLVTEGTNQGAGADGGVLIGKSNR